MGFGELLPQFSWRVLPIHTGRLARAPERPTVLHTIRNHGGTTGKAMTFVEQEIAHIARVMPPSLAGDFEMPVMGVAYWRKRLYALLKQNHLTHVQLSTVDTLLRQLDGFEALGRWLPRPKQASRHVRRVK